MRNLVSAACGIWAACALAAAAQTGPDRGPAPALPGAAATLAEAGPQRATPQDRAGSDGAVAAAGGMARSPVLVELYTAQGCSSCPPADEIMARLAGDPRVVALSLHVDYWDYLGWADRFARPEFTKRQKAYAKASGSRMIYTPQMVIGGTEAVIGNKADQIEAAIAGQAAAPRPYDIRLTLTRDRGRFVIRAEAVPPSDRQFRVQLVRYMPGQDVAIERGENAGKVVSYHNIVTAWQPLAEWQATEPFAFALPAEGEDAAVAIVQELGHGAVMAVAHLP